MQIFKDVDIYLFYTINKGMQNSSFDILMPFVTNYRNWYLIILLSILIFIIKDWKEGLITILLIVIAVSISDYLNSHIVKYIFGRVRPCSELPIETIHMPVGCPPNPSFPSSHASNIFAASTVLVYRYRVLLIYMLFIATLVCLSRVYLGVHYPFDVIAGGICGLFYGSAVILLHNQIMGRHEETKTIEGQKIE